MTSNQQLSALLKQKDYWKITDIESRADFAKIITGNKMFNDLLALLIQLTENHAAASRNMVVTHSAEEYAWRILLVRQRIIELK